MTAELRFWRRVQKLPGDGCWLWMGAKNSNGYGAISINGKSVAAHRASFEMAKGAIPAGAFVCHKCDTRACVRPDHLYAGNALTNAQDREERGRSPKTRRNGIKPISKPSPGATDGARALFSYMKENAVSIADFCAGGELGEVAVRGWTSGRTRPDMRNAFIIASRTGGVVTPNMWLTASDRVLLQGITPVCTAALSQAGVAMSADPRALQFLDEAVSALPDGHAVSGDFLEGMRAGIEHALRSRLATTPVTTRLRKMIAEYVETAERARDTYDQHRATNRRIDRHLREDAQADFEQAEKRLAKYASVDLPAVLDAVGACRCASQDRAPATRTGPTVEVTVVAPRTDDELRALTESAFGDAASSEEKLTALDELRAHFERHTANAPIGDVSTPSSPPFPSPTREQSDPERGAQ